MVPAAFEPFVTAAPFCVLARAALEGLFQPSRLDQLFDGTAQKQYTRELLFSQLVELMTAVVLRQQPSVRAAYRKGVGNISVSNQAVYDKLDGVELGVSAALVSDSAARLAPVIDQLKARRGSWLKSYRVRILDGNHLSATQRRLVGLRDAWDSPLPGKVLVAQPTLKFLFALHRVKARFVIRQHGQLEGTLLGDKRYVGRCDGGRVYEQPIALALEGRQETFRRVSVVLDEPTRDGDREVHILTNVPQKQAPAVRVAQLYRQRWTIEGLFLEVAQVLNAEPHALGYPKAALFAFCLGLLASNAVALIRAAVRAEHGVEAEEQLSVYYAALDIQQVYRGMMIALPADRWSVFGSMSADELARSLRQMVRAIDLASYRKTTRGPKKPTARKVYKNGGHVSTHKVLLNRKT